MPRQFILRIPNATLLGLYAALITNALTLSIKQQYLVVFFKFSSSYTSTEIDSAAIQFHNTHNNFDS